ncbi:MAG: hypothetical protein ACK5DE_04135 [Bacteroidota bacterium]|jgi:hypothetical protein
MKKSIPNLPASSKLKAPTGGGPSIKNPLKGKTLSMTKGAASVTKKLMKKAK